MRLVKKIGKEYVKNGRKYHFTNYYLECTKMGETLMIPIKTTFDGGYMLLDIVAEEILDDKDEVVDDLDDEIEDDGEE